MIKQSSFLRCSLLDSTKGEIRVRQESKRLLEIEYPCDNWSDCTPYKLKLLPGDYQIEVMGAQGGNSSMYMGSGGKGGYAKGKIKFEKETTLYLYIGGTGTNYDNDDTTFLGGWNGGGSGVSRSGPGGGATDIRLIGGRWNDHESLVSRILVAGGGGGCNDWTSGGAGGGLVGEKAPVGSDGQFGTQTAGGASDFAPGSFGCGGGSGNDGGGGGGGYYGGGQGDSTTRGGGGGSGYISGFPDCKAVDENGAPTESSNHISGHTFTDGEFANGYQQGHGMARIYLMDTLILFRRDIMGLRFLF